MAHFSCISHVFKLPDIMYYMRVGLGYTYRDARFWSVAKKKNAAAGADDFALRRVLFQRGCFYAACTTLDERFIFSQISTVLYSVYNKLARRAELSAMKTISRSRI